MHLTAHLDVDLVAVGTDEELTCLVELTAPVPDGLSERPGQAIIVVLDRSGSTRPSFSGAKRAVADVLRRLAPQDAFGLVTFDATADIPVPVARVADHDPGTVVRAIADLRPGASTDLSAGYLMGLREARRILESKPTLAGATVLLLSDGKANVGVTDPARLGGVALQAQREARTVTSTLGLGLRYDEVMLADLARGGGGEHRFAPDIDTAVAEFSAMAGDVLEKSVSGALLRVLPQQGLVAGIRVHGSLPNWPEADGVCINLADLYGGESRRVLVGLRVPGMAALGTATVADLVLEYTSLPELALHRMTLPVSVNVVPGDEVRGRVPDPRVTVEQLLAEVDDVKRDVAQQLRDHEEAAADRALRSALDRTSHVLTELEAAGPVDDELGERVGEVVAELTELERERLRNPGPHGAKRLTASWNGTSRGRRPRPSPLPRPTLDADVEHDLMERTRLLPDGVHLIVGDLAAQADVDALIDDADRWLRPTSGVSAALHAAAGRELARAGRSHTPLVPGEAVATPAFALRVRWVIHAAGPRHGLDRPSDELLATTHRAAVELADRLGCTAIALPAIATDAGFPLDRAAGIALRTVHAALDGCVHLRHVRFVLPDAEALAAYTAAASEAAEATTATTEAAGTGDEA